MKIAIIYDVIYPYVKGGIEKRTWELAIRFSRRGHEVHVFGMKFWDGEDILVREGLFLHGVCRPLRLYSGRRRSIWQALYFSIFLIPALLREKYDIIDCQQFPLFPCLSSRAVSLIRKTPLIITWYEIWGDYWLEYLGFFGLAGKMLERYIASFKCAMITISATTAGRFRTCYKKSLDAIVPIGIDREHIKSVPGSAEESEIIFAGRLIREKHAAMLVQAFHLLSLQYPDIRLVIIGSGPEQDEITTLIHDLSLEDHVSIREFSDNHDDLISRLKSSKVFVLPSTREGFGITALEALACGLPVVTIKHEANAIRDLIDENNGFLCSLSAEDLAVSISLALQRHTDMQKSCIHSADSFDWEHITSDIETIYRSVIEGKKIFVFGNKTN